MTVENKNPDYETYLPVWKKTRDAVRGSVAVKDKRQDYLPVPDSDVEEISSAYFLEDVSETASKQ